MQKIMRRQAQGGSSTTVVDYKEIRKTWRSMSNLIRSIKCSYIDHAENHTFVLEINQWDRHYMKSV